jgi:hypothetical protein
MLDANRTEGVSIFSETVIRKKNYVYSKNAYRPVHVTTIQIWFEAYSVRLVKI